MRERRVVVLAHLDERLHGHVAIHAAKQCSGDEHDDQSAEREVP
jgi:hypothetical protein